MSKVEITSKQGDPFLVWVAENIDTIVANGLYIKIKYTQHLSLACDAFGIFFAGDDIEHMKNLLLTGENTKKARTPATKEEYLEVRKKAINDHDAKRAKMGGDGGPVKALDEKDLKVGHATFTQQFDDMFDYTPTKVDHDFSMDPNFKYQK